MAESDRTDLPSASTAIRVLLLLALYLGALWFGGYVFWLAGAIR
jgi:hypothetical protein